MLSAFYSRCGLCAAAGLLMAAPTARAQLAHARPGYVVLASAPADTLRGEVDLRRAGRAQPQVLFRTGPAVAFRPYGLPELLAAGSPGGPHFRRCEVPRADAHLTALLEVLVAGPASLYRDPTGQLPAPYYLDKPGRSPMPLRREQFAQVLQTAFADCPTVNTTVAYAGRYAYSAADLRRYVLNYNRCAYPQAAVQAPSPKAEREPVRWAVQAGLAQGQFFYPYLARRKAAAGPLAPTLGASVEVPFNAHLGLVAGLTLGSLRADNTASQPVPTTDYVQTMRYRTTGGLLRLPVNVRYTLRPADAGWRPYLQAGGHVSHIVRGRMHWNNQYSGSAAAPPPQEFDLYYGGIGRGVQAEAGLLLRVGTHHLGAGLRYEQTHGFPNTGRSFLIDVNHLGLALTYAY
ncbi:PorT family protein [Hymenobacter sp. 15J16-1T3B]|uniref:outer membrane beta-barrel protein n=1 Tax=Hymenobacter sp. 15J16-1T3B TaxID=2886941 RepID=UPI001D1196F2|nr:outer membrane beta-barrel protein [Hymenobacter sp. 15J16-1T3B]MCC3156320.1 PorT family protein [Hymenobacter sp. 15J16-1T3B]